MDKNNKMRCSYIVSMRYQNFQKVKENGFSYIGFPERSVLAKHLNVGDLLFLYIGSRKSKIAAMVEVDSEMIWKNDLIWDDLFPTRYQIRPISVLPPDHYIDMRSIKNGLSFINPEIERFGVYFMSGIKKITDEDSKYLESFFAETNGGNKDD